MASNDKLTAGNSRSKQFTGSPVVFAPAHSVGPEPAALPSQTPNIKNEIFRAIVDQAVVGFAQADLEGRITFVNDRYCEITGYTREELLGKQWLELTHPDDRPQNIEYLEQMKRDDKPYSFEKRYLRKNGEIIWVNIGASQQHNADGQKFGGATFVIDITERKAAEKTWHESEEKLRGLYELSPLGIALTDLQGRYIEFNEAFKKICGYPEDELKTLDYWQLTPKKYAVDEARQLESLERTGHYGPYEKEYIRKDGSLVPIQLNGMLLTGSDRQKYIWSIVQVQWTPPSRQ